MARDDPELTDGGSDPVTQSRQEFRRSKTDFLSHYRLVCLDDRGASVEPRQATRSGCGRYSLGNDFLPGGGGPCLFQLILEPEVASGARQKIGQSLHAADRLALRIGAGELSRFLTRFRVSLTVSAAAIAGSQRSPSGLVQLPPSTTVASPAAVGTTRHGRALRRRSASMSAGSVVVMRA